MTPPIIVIDGNDIEVFKNAQEAELYLEPIDVRNGVYECYDANGKKLSVYVTLNEYNGFWSRILFGSTRECVVISDTDSSSDPVGLAEKLRAYCLLRSQLSAAYSQTESDLEGITLKELIETLQEKK